MQRSLLITGCSSGIGLYCARAMRDRGWRVFAACRKGDDCDRLAGEGFDAPLIDYERPATIADGFAEVMATTGGHLDGLFNNGAYAIPALLEDLPPDALRANFEANVIGWHDLTRRAVPVMRAQGAGRIVQCSSVLGFVAARWRGAYVATKFALEGLTDTLRLEMRGTGVHVASIQPGPITSEFRRNAKAQFERWIDADASSNAAEYRTLMARQSRTDKDRFELGPEAVAAALIHALESPRPRPTYRVTVPTRAAHYMKRILPARALDALLARN